MVRCLQNLTGFIHGAMERARATYEISGGSVLTLPVDKGVRALAIIRTAEPIHRVSPCGTKQTKWPRSGSPSVPFSFYEPIRVRLSSTISPSCSFSFSPSRYYLDREEASQEISKSTFASSAYLRLPESETTLWKARMILSRCAFLAR